MFNWWRTNDREHIRRYEVLLARLRAAGPDNFNVQHFIPWINLKHAGTSYQEAEEALLKEIRARKAYLKVTPTDGRSTIYTPLIWIVRTFRRLTSR